MYYNTLITGARALLGTLVVASMLFSNTLNAKDREVTIALHVSTVGFDLTRPADARKIYARLESAAWEACNSGGRVGLAPSDNAPSCYQNTLASAIKSARAPLLTRIYLDNHTLQQAAVQGVREPARMVAK
jgi:UrcA family protein